MVSTSDSDSGNPSSIPGTTYRFALLRAPVAYASVGRQRGCRRFFWPRSASTEATIRSALKGNKTPAPQGGPLGFPIESFQCLGGATHFSRILNDF